MAKDSCTSVDCTSVGIWATAVGNLLQCLNTVVPAARKFLGGNNVRLVLTTHSPPNICILHSEISSNPLCKRKCYFTMDFRKAQWHDCHIIVLGNVTLPLSYASYIATRFIETDSIHSTFYSYTYICTCIRCRIWFVLNVERSENRAIKRGNEGFVLVVFNLYNYIRYIKQ